MSKRKREVVRNCRYHHGTIRTFAASNPHADIPALRLAMWHGCCRYWLDKGIPEDAWI